MCMETTHSIFPIFLNQILFQNKLEKYLCVFLDCQLFFLHIQLPVTFNVGTQSVLMSATACVIACVT